MQNTVEEVTPVEEVETFSVEPEVDTPVVDDEVEDVSGPTTDQEAAGQGEADPSKAAKAPKQPARGELPEIEGDEYITPVAFAKLLSTQSPDGSWPYTKRGTDDEHTVPPQMVYSYLKSAKGGKNPLVTYDVTDSINVVRKNILKKSEALAWWAAKNERAGERAANAKAKAEKKTAEPKDTSTSDTPAEPVGEVVEAE